MHQCDLKIVSWNVNGVRNRIADIHYFITKHSIDVLLLQETGNRDADSFLSLKGYQGYHLSTREGVRGVSTYVKKSIPSELVEEPDRIEGTESLAVRVYLLDRTMNIVNVYVSRNCFDVASIPDCVFNEVTLLAGDFNARHGRLEDPVGSNNVNGAAFSQFLQDHADALILGQAEATHIQGGRLDYACLLNGQGLSGTCEIQTDLLSDHFALLIAIPLRRKVLQHSRTRLVLPRSKDKINSFLENIMHWYNHYTPDDLDSFYADLLQQIEKYLYIPQRMGRLDKTRKKHESYTEDKMVITWNRLLRVAHKKWIQSEKSETTRQTLLETAKICGEMRNEARGQYWENFANKIGNCQSSQEIWREVNKVRGKRQKNMMHPQPEVMANQLADQWRLASHSDGLPPEVQQAVKGWERERRGLIEVAVNMGGPTCTDLTHDELLRAIKRGKSTAPGDDGMTYEVLNCLAAINDGPLLQLFNMSFREGRLPRAWKRATIIPIPKPGGGFRPVSLTSCFSKMMERILLEKLQYIIGDSLHDSLFGFVKGKGTAGALINCLGNDSDYCRTFIDLKGAFDKANGEIILYELANLGVSSKLLHWIGDYLQGRWAVVCYQGATSLEICMELGTPQGGVLSPTLFNVLMNRLARADWCPGINATFYADDILLQGKKMKNMQDALKTFNDMTKKLGLVIN